MINPVNKVMDAWFALIGSALTVPVVRVDSPTPQDGNYVILRVESYTASRTNSSRTHNPVIITEVITRFSNGEPIDDSVVSDIDSEIEALLYTTADKHNLPQQTGIQIVSVSRQNATYLPEDDGTFRYHRLITRNVHRVTQT